MFQAGELLFVIRLSRDAQHISQQIPQRHGAVRHAPQQRRQVPQQRDVQRHGAAHRETAQQAAHGAQDTWEPWKAGFTQDMVIVGNNNNLCWLYIYIYIFGYGTQKRIPLRPLQVSIQ